MEGKDINKENGAVCLLKRKRSENSNELAGLLRDTFNLNGPNSILPEGTKRRRVPSSVSSSSSQSLPVSPPKPRGRQITSLKTRERQGTPPPKTRKTEAHLPAFVLKRRPLRALRIKQPPNFSLVTSLLHVPTETDKFLLGIYSQVRHDGYRITQKEKNALNFYCKESRNLEGFGPQQYGEICTEASSKKLLSLLGLTSKSPTSVFCDFGSGVGKVVFYVALQNLCLKSIGIELDQNRHQSAIDAHILFKDALNKPGTRIKTKTSIELHNADIREADLTDVTHIFWNNLCFHDSSAASVWETLCHVKRGTRIAVFKPPCPNHNLVKCLQRSHSGTNETPLCCHFTIVAKDYLPTSWSHTVDTWILERN